MEINLRKAPDLATDGSLKGRVVFMHDGQEIKRAFKVPVVWDDLAFTVKKIDPSDVELTTLTSLSQWVTIADLEPKGEEDGWAEAMPMGSNRWIPVGPPVGIRLLTEDWNKLTGEIALFANETLGRTVGQLHHKWESTWQRQPSLSFAY